VPNDPVRRSDARVLAETQYDEFASELYLFAAPLCARVRHIVFAPHRAGWRGRPCIFVFGKRAPGARYAFPLSISIRWRDAPITEYLQGDTRERGALREKFARKLPALLEEIETRYGVDWNGGSQASAQAITVDLDEF
jgi:hypothetical protein